MTQVLHNRILQRLSEFPCGKASYHALMWGVWPADKYPRAYRHSTNGGPPGVAMIYGKALRELRERGFITRCPRYIGSKEERFGQPDVMLLSGGRRKLAAEQRAEGAK